MEMGDVKVKVHNVHTLETNTFESKSKGLGFWATTDWLSVHFFLKRGVDKAVSKISK
jgi:hypothetical protein